MPLTRPSGNTCTKSLPYNGFKPVMRESESESGFEFESGFKAFLAALRFEFGFRPQKGDSIPIPDQ